ncbi:hypothetical protein SDJN03_10734, partial [Cucurbita argyrosperma subsp. sororia]
MASDSGFDFKSHLASEIFSFSARTVSCAHRHFSRPFFDWYRLLGVEEDAGIDSIRRRYLKLALQLHPDKNPHPKAEFAFKLVSQGYACLSDNVKRTAFDLDRMKNFCPDCNTIPYTNLTALNVLGSFNKNNKHGGVKNIKERLREESNVIENCLLKNTSRFHHINHKESPIFNPSDYVSQGYPHFRTRIHPKPQNFRCFRSGNSLKYEQGRGQFEYPLFEVRSESFHLQKQSAFVYSNDSKSH